jgi:hypothetical protein
VDWVFGVIITVKKVRILCESVCIRTVSSEVPRLRAGAGRTRIRGGEDRKKSEKSSRSFCPWRRSPGDEQRRGRERNGTEERGGIRRKEA